ncbi:MAG: ABC transporter substrate-binding protein [Anaerolineae bacterium]|nr:ABC transporter substrate-binding protein [Anaerolineae bacterium]
MTRLKLVTRGIAGLVTLALILVVGVPLAGAQDGGARTVVDALGRNVTLDVPPQRVVGLSSSVTEMLYAIGVTPVGATEGMTFPPEAAELPTIGTGYQPDLEALAALEPDLIVANAQLQAQILDQLEAIAPVVYELILVPQDIPETARLLGEITWHDTSAGYLAGAYEQFLALAGTLGTAQDGPSILIIVGTLDQPNYGKSETYLGAMAAMLGATNVADGEEDAGPFPGYAQLSIERILEADPDVILTITRGAPGAPPIPDTMAGDPVWSALAAYENGRVFELDNRLFLESPGPRFVDAVIQLYDILYGEGM